MANLLAGAESALAGGFFDGRFRDGELLAAAGEEFGDVLDGVVGAGGSGGLLRCIPAAGAALPGGALIFVFVGAMGAGGVVESSRAAPRWTGESARPHITSSRACAAPA